jgi:hypothetical protein
MEPTVTLAEIKIKSAKNFDFSGKTPIFISACFLSNRDRLPYPPRREQKQPQSFDQQARFYGSFNITLATISDRTLK